MEITKTDCLMILYKGAEVFAPDYLGRKDILTGGGKILAIADEIPFTGKTVPGLEVIKADGLRAVPGFIDGHVHVAGSGGEGGPATRTPELSLSRMLKGGVTTVIGLLGTDGFTRHPESVLMKVKGLRAEGVSAWMLTGAYQVPTPTLTGDVGRDISLFDEIIGVGEVAIADHRSSEPTVHELIRLAVHARIGGMLGGKAGIVNLHIGNRKNPFSLIYKAVEQSDLTFAQFLPTHCNRTHSVLEEAKKYGLNGCVDITSYPGKAGKDAVDAAEAIMDLLGNGVPVENITTTSDGCGSMPVFDEKGNYLRMGIGSPDAIFTTFKKLVNTFDLSWEKALKMVSTNPATVYKLQGKGRLQPGKDADILLLDDRAELQYLMANGEMMIRAGHLLKKGTFENENQMP
jgi:beta-aspartyl-dipeptidase (metallo-type)